MGMEASWVLGHWSGRAAFGALFLSLTACDEGPFLQTEEFAARGGLERYLGGSCISVDAGNGLGGGKVPLPEGAAGESGESGSFAYSFSYEGRDKDMHFQVADGAGRVLAERSYSEAFLGAGRKDEVKVDVGAQELRFVHRGVAECQPIREPDRD
jgi:hypothetical protein